MSLITDTAIIVRRLRDGKPCIDAQNNEPCRCRDAVAGCDCTIAAEEIERKDAIIKQQDGELEAIHAAHADMAKRLSEAGAENAKLRAALENVIEAINDNDDIAAYAYARTALGNADEQTPP